MRTLLCGIVYKSWKRCHTKHHNKQKPRLKRIGVTERQYGNENKSEGKGRGNIGLWILSPKYSETVHIKSNPYLVMGGGSLFALCSCISKSIALNIFTFNIWNECYKLKPPLFDFVSQSHNLGEMTNHKHFKKKAT